MLTATRCPVIPYALRPALKKRWDPNRPADYDRGNHTFVDPWLKVCARCPLRDCILPEGGLRGNEASRNAGRYDACPVVAAGLRGWDAAAAVRRGPELGLLEVGE